MDFNSWTNSVREICQDNNTPLKIENGHWSVNDRLALWNLLGTRIFDSHLELIKECALTVLKEILPELDLSPEERYAAAIHGKISKFSKDIRKGISETLALLGTYPQNLKNCSLHKPETTAIMTIREIFQNSSWQLWASLNNLLPILAEASPEEFLNSVENTFKKVPCPFDELFKQEDSGFTSRSYMTGLLWALEELAWSEEYLARVSLILAELANRDPGGKWANRPINSLTTIFLPWFPQTTTSIEKRISALKSVVKEYPQIAWKVLITLLPSQHQVSMGAYKPTWRKFIPNNWEAKISTQEYWAHVNSYSKMTLNLAKESIEKTIQLTKELDNLPEPSFSTFLKYLTSEASTNLSDDNKRIIWETLNAFVNKHRRYSDAEWALKGDVVDRIERVCKEFTPKNDLDLYHRLFSENDFNLYETSGDWHTQQQLLDEQRQKAIVALFSVGGIETIINFLEKIDKPYLVGWAVGITIKDDIDNYLLPTFFDKEDSKIQKFIEGFIRGRFYIGNIGWADNINRKSWTNKQICQLLLYFPFENDTWERAEKWLGVEEDNYWKKIVSNPYSIKSKVFIAVDKLLKVARPRFALKCLTAYYFSTKEFDSDRAVRALLLGIASNEPVMSMDQHETIEIIKKLQDDPKTSEDELFKIEWAYLPLLDEFSNAKPKTLEKMLSTRPEFFCEIIRLMYRSKKNVNKEVEQTDENKLHAKNAWELLYIWKRPPGLNEDGTFSEDILLKWIKCVKNICSESGHLEVALIHLGNVLFYAPPDPNGLWINKAIANILNDKDAENEREGYSTELFNSRGAHWVNPTGESERQIASKWRKNADEVEKDGFVHFAAKLKEIAKSYDREAERILAEHNSDKNNEAKNS